MAALIVALGLFAFCLVAYFVVDWLIRRPVNMAGRLDEPLEDDEPRGFYAAVIGFVVVVVVLFALIPVAR